MTTMAPVWLEGFATKNATRLRTAVREVLGSGGHECILHPLGFYFIRLAKDGDVSIRLHYWPTADRQVGTALTPFHDHVWKLDSCILYGQIENVVLDLEENEKGIFRLATISQAGGIDDVVAEGPTVNTRTRSRDVYTADTFYEMEPRIFHFTDVLPGQAAITIVKSEVVSVGGPRTLVPLEFSSHAPARNPVPSADQLVREIITLLDE